MSVIPQEDKLTMTFDEATKVFNHNRTQSYQQQPRPIRNPSRPRESPLLESGGPMLPDPLPMHEDTNGEYITEEEPKRHASVVPQSRLPSHHCVLRNPEQVVEFSHPRQMEVVTDSEEEEYFNPWFSTREYMKIYFSEFLGTMILVLWGEGTQAQVVAARKEPGDYLSIAWGWGVGFMLAIYVSSGISGGHINPAVTISLALFRKFPWRRVPGYIISQLLGGFAAAAVIYGVYWGPLHSGDIGYAGVLTTGPNGLLPTVASTFFSVFIGACLLMGSIAAFTDTGNNPTSAGLTPLLLGLVMVGIASSFGYQTGFVLNPARDLGPRLLVWATGATDSHTLWLANSAYGIWIPTAGAISGAAFGIFLYDILIYKGRDSPVNFNWSRRGRKQRRMSKRASMEVARQPRPSDLEAANRNLELANQNLEKGSIKRSPRREGVERMSGSTYMEEGNTRTLRE